MPWHLISLASACLIVLCQMTKPSFEHLSPKLKEHGSVLIVVDQPATIGALPVALARAEGVAVAYLPGLAMRRIADLHAGEAKTDARDAYIIAEAARSMPHTLRSLKLADNEVAELTMLCGFDDDLAGQAKSLKPAIASGPADADTSCTRACRRAASGSSRPARSDRATSVARSTCGASVRDN